MNEKNKKILDYAVMIGNLLVIMGIHFGVFTLLVKILPFFEGQYPWLKNLMVNNWQVFFYFWSPIAALLFYLFLKLKKKNIWKFCKFKKITGQQILLILICGIAGALFTFGFINLSFIREHFPRFTWFINFYNNEGHIVIVVIAVMFIMPVYEELIFRGGMYNVLAEKVPVGAAIFVQSFIYGASFFEGHFLMALFSLLAALLYSVIYYLSDSIWGNILVQFVIATLLLVVVRTGGNVWLGSLPDVILLGMIVVSLVVIALSLVFLRKQRKFVFVEAAADAGELST